MEQKGRSHQAIGRSRGGWTTKVYALTGSSLGLTDTDDRLCRARGCMMANTTKRRFPDEFKLKAVAL